MYAGNANPDARKTLNRHDAKVATDAMFRFFHHRTQEPVSGAFRSFVPFPQEAISLGVFGALAVENFGLGLNSVPYLRTLVHSYGFLHVPFRLENSQFFPLRPSTTGPGSRACSLAMRLGESLRR